MYDFVKMMYDAGCDIKPYVSSGVISAYEYAKIISSVEDLNNGSDSNDS